MRRISLLGWTLPLLIVTVIFSFLTLSAWAQSTTGSIVGWVNDPSKAAVVGAQVVAVNERTGVSYPTKTGPDGHFDILSLPPSDYHVTVANAGFETAVAKNIHLTIDQKQLVNFQLKVGATSTEVLVTAAPTMLQTQTAETGEVIQSGDILNLPLDGRRFTDLVSLVPGVVQGGTSSHINSFSYGISGGRAYGNSIQVDGMESTSNRSQDLTVSPSVDSVEEFRVSTSSFSAEFGRAAGGVISIQTKAGTNSYHGDLYEFFRPNFTAAKNYAFGGVYNPPPTLKQHNAGGTIGGPIFKNKTFFFGSYEATRVHNAFDYLYRTMPVDQVKFLPDGSIDLSGMVDPNTGNMIPVFDPLLSVANYGGYSPPFAGNIIPANRVSQAGVNTLLNFFPKPNLPGTSHGWYNNYQVHSPTRNRQDSVDARLDHDFSAKDRLSFVAHYTYSNQLTTDPYTGHTVVPGGGDADQGQNANTHLQEYTLSETHFFSPRLLNEFRAGFMHFTQAQYSLLSGTDYSTKYGWGNIAVPGFSATDAYPWIYMGSGALVGGSTYKPYLVGDDNFEIGDKITLSQLGKHQLKFGAEYRHLRSHPYFSLFPTSFVYFAGPYYAMTADYSYTYFDPNALFGNGGSDMADLLLGVPFSAQRGLQLTDPHTKSWELHFYGEDTYRMTPRFTLTYGMRYEFQAPYSEDHNNLSNYDPVTDSFQLAGRGSNSAALINSRTRNFEPRLGFAYQVDPKTVVRAGYGFFYSPENDGREEILSKNYPFATQQLFSNYIYNGPCQAPNPCTGVLNYQIDAGVARSKAVDIPSGASSIPASSIVNGNLIVSSSVNPQLKTGYAQNYNLSVQRELGSNFALEWGYIGSVSHDLSYKLGNINREDPVTGIPKLTPNLGTIEAQNSVGYALYNSLQVKLTKRVSRNLNFLASYTYGHSIDNGPAPFDLGQNNDYPQDPYNLKPEWGSSDTDVRHNFSFSGSYALPFGRGQALLSGSSAPLNLLIGGWQLNTIFAMRTGTPVNVIRASYTTDFQGLRPDLVGDPHSGTCPNGSRVGSLDCWFNTSAFSNARFTNCDTGADPYCQFAVGTAGRNLVNGPGLISADVSLFKTFAIKDRFKLQTRAEAFNASNSPHFCGPSGDMGYPGTFGTIQYTCSNMREVQLDVKFIF